MSILGKFTKQPIEVEVYSIQFVEDLSETDEITATYQTIARKGSTPWDRVVQADPYTILSTDDGKTIVGTANMTLPTGVSDGFRVNVSNKSQNSNITVGTFTVLARSAAVITRVAGAWVVEASTQAILVNAIGDQRVRTFVTGGTGGIAYEVQVTVDTSEGRILQDEFILKIKEV